MVDDRSKRSGGKNGGAAPDGNAASAANRLPTAAVASEQPRDSMLALGLGRASVELPDLNSIDAGWEDEQDAVGVSPVSGSMSIFAGPPASVVPRPSSVPPASTHIDVGWDDEEDSAGASVVLVPKRSVDSGLIAVIPGPASSVVTCPPASVAPPPTSVAPGPPTYTAALDSAIVPGQPEASGPAPSSDAVELTPSPMVVCEAPFPVTPFVPNEIPSFAAATNESSVFVAAGEDVIWRGQASVHIGGYAWRHEVLPPDEEAPLSDRDEALSNGESQVGHAEYHAPRPPPSSAPPPKIEASFSVATEFDPQSSTRPRIPRVGRIRTPPLLFGIDRMLVWGLVLGGLFVAIIVVIVNQVALTHMRRSAPPMGKLSDDTRKTTPTGSGSKLRQSDVETAGPNDRLRGLAASSGPSAVADPKVTAPSTSAELGSTQARDVGGAHELDGGAAPRSTKSNQTKRGRRAVAPRRTTDPVRIDSSDWPILGAP